MELKKLIIKKLGANLRFLGLKLNHKNTAIVIGVMAQMLIMQGAIHIEEDFFYSIAEIVYAFGILLPISYYNMKEDEREAQ